MASAIHVTVGVTGGIAAYKAVELVRLLQRAGLDPHVVMTAAAQRFVTPLTFAAITGHRVVTSLWSGSEGDDAANLASAIDHIDEAQTTRLLVVAPATADTLAKFAHGLADDFLSTLYLATTAPVLVAPAMNVNMWSHPATRANLETLLARGVRILSPGEGYLACGMVGSGRLAEPPEIARAVLETLNLTAPEEHAAIENTASASAPGAPSFAPLRRVGATTTPPSTSLPAQGWDEPSQPDLAAETILITAGGTREPIDPVRFLGNRSSGRMGYALAHAAHRRGAKVILVSAAKTLPPPDGVELIPVETAEEMRSAVLACMPQATMVLKAAAVADYRVRHHAAQKIRRSGPLTLELEPTPDILAEIAARRRPHTLILAFAAETDTASLLANARAKLARKGADALFVNDVSQPGIGIDADDNAGTLLTPTGETTLAPMPKIELAHRLLDAMLQLRTR